MFILASSVCKSLQCLISTLPQGGKGSHLFRLTCSIVLWRGRNTANKCHWCVWGVMAMSGPYWVCPHSRMCAFPVYTAQAPGCSARELSKTSPGLHALPRSMSLKFRFLGTAQRHRLSWACVCALPRSEQLRRPGAWQARSPQVGQGVLSPPPSQPLSFVVSGVLCVSSGELISGCDPPGGCQPSRIPGRLG